MEHNDEDPPPPLPRAQEEKELKEDQEQLKRGDSGIVNAAAAASLGDGDDDEMARIKNEELISAQSAFGVTMDAIGRSDLLEDNEENNHHGNGHNNNNKDEEDDMELKRAAIVYYDPPAANNSSGSYKNVAAGPGSSSEIIRRSVSEKHIPSTIRTDVISNNNDGRPSSISVNPPLTVKRLLRNQQTETSQQPPSLARHSTAPATVAAPATTPGAYAVAPGQAAKLNERFETSTLVGPIDPRKDEVNDFEAQIVNYATTTSSELLRPDSAVAPGRRASLTERLMSKGLVPPDSAGAAASKPPPELPEHSSTNTQDFTRTMVTMYGDGGDITAPPSSNELIEASTVDELVQVDAKPIEWWTPRKVMKLGLGAALLLIATIVSVSVVIRKNNNKKSYAVVEEPTAAPTLPPEERFQVIGNILREVATNFPASATATGRLPVEDDGVVVSTAVGTLAIEDLSSPQYQAWEWIAYNDTHRVSPYDVDHLLQRYALAVLYFSTLGQGENGWATTYEFLDEDHECSWSGALQCSSAASSQEQEVDSKSDFDSKNTDSDIKEAFVIGGTIIGIDLSENDLIGQLPAEVNLLTALKSLVLNGNRMSGTLPPLMLSHLTHLGLKDNNLEGTIPTEYSGFLGNLQSLQLGNNALTGILPNDLGVLTGLTTLSLESNHLSGQIPDSIWNLSNMVSFTIGQQGLTGQVSPLIGQWVNTTEFQINKLNGITGPLPSEIGLLTKMTNLKVSQNHMRGSLPSELGNLKDMEVLALSRNGFTGTVPTEIVQLTNLRELYVQNTWLEGSMQFMCTAIGNGDLPYLSVMNADMPEVNCTCCTCCLY